MQEYAVGFAFSPDNEVALIRKNRPEWQAGKLNGIGGHVEPGETPLEAMVREFDEETGTYVHRSYWREVAVMDFPGARITFFKTSLSLLFFRSLHTTTDEPIVKIDHRNLGGLNIIPNLTWLIPLAAYEEDNYEPIHVVAQRADAW